MATACRPSCSNLAPGDKVKTFLTGCWYSGIVKHRVRKGGRGEWFHIAYDDGDTLVINTALNKTKKRDAEDSVNAEQNNSSSPPSPVDKNTAYIRIGADYQAEIPKWSECYVAADRGDMKMN